MSDLNKLQNMDHQELTNSVQRPEDQAYEKRDENKEEREKSGLGTDTGGPEDDRERPRH